MTIVCMVQASIRKQPKEQTENGSYECWKEEAFLLERPTCCVQEEISLYSKQLSLWLVLVSMLSKSLALVLLMCWACTG